MQISIKLDRQVRTVASEAMITDYTQRVVETDKGLNDEAVASKTKAIADAAVNKGFVHNTVFSKLEGIMQASRPTCSDKPVVDTVLEKVLDSAECLSEEVGCEADVALIAEYRLAKNTYELAKAKLAEAIKPSVERAVTEFTTDVIDNLKA